LRLVHLVYQAHLLGLMGNVSSKMAYRQRIPRKILRGNKDENGNAQPKGRRKDAFNKDLP